MAAQRDLYKLVKEQSMKRLAKRAEREQEAEGTSPFPQVKLYRDFTKKRAKMKQQLSMGPSPHYYDTDDLYAEEDEVSAPSTPVPEFPEDIRPKQVTEAKRTSMYLELEEETVEPPITSPVDVRGKGIGSGVGHRYSKSEFDKMLDKYDAALDGKRRTAPLRIVPDKAAFAIGSKQTPATLPTFLKKSAEIMTPDSMYSADFPSSKRLAMFDRRSRGTPPQTGTPFSTPQRYTGKKGKASSASTVLKSMAFERVKKKRDSGAAWHSAAAAAAAKTSSMGFSLEKRSRGGGGGFIKMGGKKPSLKHTLKLTSEPVTATLKYTKKLQSEKVLSAERSRAKTPEPEPIRVESTTAPKSSRRRLWTSSRRRRQRSRRVFTPSPALRRRKLVPRRQKRHSKSRSQFSTPLHSQNAKFRFFSSPTPPTPPFARALPRLQPISVSEQSPMHSWMADEKSAKKSDAALAFGSYVSELIRSKKSGRHSEDEKFMEERQSSLSEENEMLKKQLEVISLEIARLKDEATTEEKDEGRKIHTRRRSVLGALGSLKPRMVADTPSQRMRKWQWTPIGNEYIAGTKWRTIGAKSSSDTFYSLKADDFKVVIPPDFEVMFASSEAETDDDNKDDEAAYEQEIIDVAIGGIPKKRGSKMKKVLKSLKCTPASLRASLVSADSSHFGRRLLRALLTIKPTLAEIEYVRRKVEVEQVSKASLKPEELFAFCFKGLDRLNPRLKLWQKKISIEDATNELLSDVTKLRDALTCIQTSANLPRILRVIVEVGNYLNCSPKAPIGSYGFQLDSLSTLTQVKASRRYLSAQGTEGDDYNLLSFVYGLCKAKYPLALEVATELKQCREFVAEASSGLDLSVAVCQNKEELRDFSKQLRAFRAKQLTADGSAKARPSIIEVDKFEQSLIVFLKKAERDCENGEQIWSECVSLGRQIGGDFDYEYRHTYSFEEIVLIFGRFVADLKQEQLAFERRKLLQSATDSRSASRADHFAKSEELAESVFADKKRRRSQAQVQISTDIKLVEGQEIE